MVRKHTIDDFWDRVVKTDTCWLYTGYIMPNGYGVFGAGYAHRRSYEMFKGPIPKGMFVCHTCDVRNCVNPEHLFLGTHQDNMDDMALKGRRADSEQTRRVGVKNGRAKLTEEDVISIRSVPYVRGVGRKLAKHFGVTPTMISFIRNNKFWTHITTGR